ncbi:MAG: hypothetical protein ABSG26_24145 [Bryobacteraceae bacterium]|jgi:hypothetical protein
MRFAILFLLLGCVTCPATTIYDPFNQSQAGGCNYSLAPPFTSCDVIGNPALFDIQKASVDIAGGWATVTIYFNYGGGITLQPFTDGVLLAVGDLFFYSPSDPGHDLYGVPLVSHGGFTADDLYLISGNTTLLTADDIIHNTGYYYRRTQDVRLGGSGSPETIGQPVQVAPYGNGVSDALYAVTLQFPVPADFVASVIQNGQLGISFSSAECANDILEGTLSVAPEPGMFGFLAVGVAMLAGSGALRRKRARRLVRVSRLPS